jgi:hypothetical protein
MKTAITSFLLVIALVACNDPKPPEYRGGLYFGQGAYLMRFSLRDGSLAIAGHLGATTIREISALGGDNLLVAELAIVNRRRIPRISWIDVKTGESSDLYAGVLARYLPNPNVIVYDDGMDLFAVPQAMHSTNEIIFSHAPNRLSRLIEASPGNLLFESGEPEEPAIHSWNAQTGELRELNYLAATCTLHGAVWINTIQRLVCIRRDGATAVAEYVLADLEGTVDRALNVPADKQFLALTYIDKQNALVLQEVWRSLLGSRDKHAVWIHDVHTGASHRIASNVNLRESVVFAEY